MLEARALLAVTIGDPTPIIPAGNLVQNGSFEENVVTHSQKWNVFAPGTMAAWNIVPATVGVKAEIQRNGVGGWNSSQGSQWLELDGDENGPGKKWDATAMGRPERGLYSIHQPVSVTAGLTYTLMFDFAARPGTKQSQNAMQVRVLDAITDAPGAAIVSERVTALSTQVVAKSAKPVWQMGTITFVAPADGNVVLEFRGLGQGDPFNDPNHDPATDALNDTYGMFLDNVVIVQTDLRISGTITYEGPTGIENDYALTFGTLPVRAARVEIWDQNSFQDTLVGTTYTDDNGFYDIRISSVDTGAFGGFVDPYIVVVAQSAPESVVTIAHEVAIPGGTGPARMRFVEPDDVTSHGPGTLTLDGAMTDHGNRNPNGAFSVFDAIYSSSRYHVTLPGVKPATVKAGLTETEITAFTIDGRIQINTLDRFGWDVIGHEYGHFAHVHAGVVLPHIPDHSFAENMRFSYPVNGWRLAFTEGFATYFSLVAQALTPKPPIGVAGFGDTEYWGISPLERNDGIQLASRTDIETRGPRTIVEPGFEQITPVGLGEDNEVSVFRVLWDLYDPANDDPIGDIGDVGVWVLVVSADAEAHKVPEFYSAYLNLTAGVNTERVWEIGQVLAAHNIVPSPIRVDYGADFMFFDPPTFVVSALYGSTDGVDQDQWLFDSVEIRFYSDTGERIDVSGSSAMAVPVDQSPEISWTPTSDQWFELVVGGVSRWSVVATTKSGGRLVSQYESFARTVAFG